MCSVRRCVAAEASWCRTAGEASRTGSGAKVMASSSAATSTTTSAGRRAVRRRRALRASCTSEVAPRRREDSLGSKEVDQLALAEGDGRELPRRVGEIESLLLLIELQGRAEVIDQGREDALHCPRVALHNSPQVGLRRIAPALNLRADAAQLFVGVEVDAPGRRFVRLRLDHKMRITVQGRRASSRETIGELFS